MFGLVLESLGIVEVYKFDITTNDFQELWNPEFNAGVYIVYVDWENEVIFTENTNTDKPLPKNFKYQIQMFNNRKHEAKIIASSIGSRIEILNKENGRIEYKEIKDGIDKVSVFLY